MVRRCECEGRKDMDRPDQTTHFGFRDVPLGDKQTLVNDVFHSVARRYDLMNDLMSAGLHRVWKDIMVNTLNPPRSDHPYALLDVPGRSFDGYTIAFGIRNVPRIDLALKEAYRVLKPGGRFLCLEFSSVDVPGLDRIYDLFSFKVIPPLGGAVTGDAESYRYLVESIRKFPKPNAFAEMIRGAGFSRVNWQSFSGGIVALHSGWRL